MRRLLVRTTGIVLLLIVAGVLSVGYLLHSERGTRWLFSQVDGLTPGAFSFVSLDGRLTGPLDLTGVAYREGELVLEIDRLRLDWAPRALLRGRLHILALAVSGTRLTLPQAEPPAEPAPAAPFVGFSLPLGVVIDAVEIEDVRLTTTDGEPAVMERLHLRAEGSDSRVSIASLIVDAFDTHAEVAGGLRLEAGLPIDLALDWRHKRPEGPELSGRGTLAGHLGELLVTQRFAAPIAGELRARLLELETDPRWDATLTLEEANIGAFSDAFPALVSGELRSSGSPTALKAGGRVNLVEGSIGRIEAEFDAGFADGVATIERLLLTAGEGRRIEGTARYTPDDREGRLEADLNWVGLEWPLTGEPPQFSSESGRLELDGAPSEYSYSIELAGQVPQAPPMQIRAAGTGNLERLVLDRLGIDLAEGRIAGEGWATWAPEPGWQLRLVGTGIDPALLNPELTGLLNLQIDTDGRVVKGVPKARAVLTRLDGELLDYKVEGHGALTLDGETLEVDGLELSSGANRLRVNGTAGDRFALDWSLQADQLETLWPGLAGQIDAAGRLSGTPDAPRLEANVDGSRLGFDRHRVGRLQARADLGLGKGERLRLDLQAAEIASAGMEWKALSLNLDGARERHTLDVDLTGSDTRYGRFTLNGGLDAKDNWKGELTRMNLALEEGGPWRLADPAPLRFGSGDAELKRLCLASGEARVCGDFTALAETASWKAALDATGIPLAAFQRWMPPESTLDGRAGLTAAFQGDRDAGVRGRADLAVPAGSLTFPFEETTQRLDFSGSRVGAVMDDQGLSANLDLPLAGMGGVEGRARLPGFRPEAPELERQSITGRIDARIEDLGLVSLVVPQFQNVRGRVEAAFALSGPVLEPRIDGGAELKEAAIDIPEIGLELRQIELRVAAPEMGRITLEGAVASGKGRLTVNGETLIRAEQGYPTTLRIQGEDWTAINTAEAEAHISPDLTIKSHARRTDIEGDVVVPFARVRPRKLPESSVSSTSDLVVVGGDKPVEEVEPSTLYSSVRIVLGDRVNFEGFGLRADLKGELLVIDEPSRPVIGRGRIGVTQGTYRGYGQDLKIERGYALFADSPVDDPGLDVEAIRQAGDVTAGLRVTGTLKKPNLEVFSTPSMSEADAISYLLTGRPMGERGGAESAGVTAALQASGIGSVTSEIGRQFGLDELRVDTGGGLAEASVVAGTYLSPRLYVQYVNELATGEVILRLRHDLTERIQIQTETGRSQGLDLFYTFER